jgi:hypothetical protein
MFSTQGKTTIEGDVELAVADEYDVIVERLESLYPSLDVIAIKVAVTDATRQFEHARLKMFVPLLVEKIARDECRRLVAFHVRT